MDLKKIIRNIEDFPEKDILFRDITTVLMDKDALKLSVDKMTDCLRDTEFDLVIGPESRGFIYGMPIAYILNKGFIPVRKKGKLPFDVISQSYDLEYGSATIEMHTDAIKKGQRVVIVDDLLATGGTSKAIIDLIEKAGGIVVKSLFFIELEDLNGRKNLCNCEVESIIKY